MLYLEVHRINWALEFAKFLIALSPFLNRDMKRQSFKRLNCGKLAITMTFLTLAVNESKNRFNYINLKRLSNFTIGAVLGIFLIQCLYLNLKTYLLTVFSQLLVLFINKHVDQRICNEAFK